MYWIYQTHIYVWHNNYVQAKLIKPHPHSLVNNYGQFGFKNPMQDEIYGVDLQLTYQINQKHPHPDNYFENAGFKLYSEKLVKVMQSYRVKAEYFSVFMVDDQGISLLDLSYSVFHSLEGILAAMDEEKSGWIGNHDVGIPNLVLDYTKFQHRPMFLCNHIYLPLMRDDLKQEIEHQGITGFDFIKPERYNSGSYGQILDFDE